MGKFAEIFLGILTAMGGFVEIGELTFTLNGGTRFQYALLWVSLLGTVGIMVYCEMAGRIAAVRHQAVFSLIRERDGFSAGLLTLVTANVINLLTCAAEVGGVALLWQLLPAGRIAACSLRRWSSSCSLSGSRRSNGSSASSDSAASTWRCSACSSRSPARRSRRRCRRPKTCPVRRLAVGLDQLPHKAPRFALSWIAVFVLATAVVMTGIDPISVVEYSIVFSVVVLPLSYFPVLAAARDKTIMGKYTNGPVANVLGWFYLALITIAALAAIPLFVATHGGQG